jgi:hypothetical protein
MTAFGMTQMIGKIKTIDLLLFLVGMIAINATA